LAANVYECMVIFEPNKYTRDPAGVSAQLQSGFEKHGAEILASRLWNEQKLAYPIDGARKGVYWLTYFRVDSLNLTAINRDLRLNENLLRHLVIRIDPRLVETLVAIAKGEKVLETPRIDLDVNADEEIVSDEEEVGVLD
jgi:small subunit ribosomal protein S6